MPLFRRGIPATQLARDFGVTLNDFTSQVDSLLGRLTENEASMPAPQRGGEVCSAVWAAISASFEASSLSPEEREKLAPLVQEVLIPFWQKHCSNEPGMATILAERTTLYLHGKDSRSQVATATVIVSRLLDTIGVNESLKPQLLRRLIPLFAHRMLGDIHHINHAKTRYGIQLPILAAIVATAEVVAVYEPALKMLKLS